MPEKWFLLSVCVCLFLPFYSLKDFLRKYWVLKGTSAKLKWSLALQDYNMRGIRIKNNKNLITDALPWKTVGVNFPIAVIQPLNFLKVGEMG